MADWSGVIGIPIWDFCWGDVSSAFPPLLRSAVSCVLFTALPLLEKPGVSLLLVLLRMSHSLSFCLWVSRKGAPGSKGGEGGQGGVGVLHSGLPAQRTQPTESDEVAYCRVGSVEYTSMCV